MPQIEGSEHLALSVEEVWKRLNEPAMLAEAIPGCRTMTAEDEGRFRTTLDIAVGAVRGTYDGFVFYEDLEPPERCTIAIEGKGTHGSIEGRGTLSLVMTADGTAVNYVGRFDVQGRVAGVGARVMSGVSRKLIVETLRNLAALAPATEGPVPEAGAQGAAGEADSEGAAGGVGSTEEAGRFGSSGAAPEAGPQGAGGQPGFQRAAGQAGPRGAGGQVEPFRPLASPLHDLGGRIRRWWARVVAWTRRRA